MRFNRKTFCTRKFGFRNHFMEIKVLGVNDPMTNDKMVKRLEFRIDHTGRVNLNMG